jgi:autotransporter-associated beta strand protein
MDQSLIAMGGSPMKISVAVVAVVVVGPLLGNVRSLRAETWVQPNAGSWNVAGNWSPASVPNGAGASATFNSDQTATSAVTLDAAIKVGSITITNLTTFQNQIQNGTGSLDFDAASGDATFTVNGVDTGVNPIQNRLEATMTLTDNLRVINNNPNNRSTGAASVLGIMNGPGGLILEGVGTTTVAFTPGTTDRFKDYTGPTIIDSGRGRFSQSANSPPRMTSHVTVNPGGQIIFANTGTAQFGSLLASPSPVNLNGNGLAAFPGAIRADQGASRLDNPVVLQSNASINVVSVSVSGGNLASYELLREVSGPGILTFGARPGLLDRRGTLILSAANTYSGGTIIEQGNVRVIGSGTLGTGTTMVDGNQTNVDAAFDTFGVLTLETANTIPDTAFLNVTGGGAANTADRGYVDIFSGIDEVVGGLMLGGVIYGPGTYGIGAPNPGLTNPDEYFTGSGTITVSATACGGGVCVPGDYNGNGIVDAADYVMWRKGGPLANDFTPGNQPADYDFWRSRFGATTNPGSGSGLGESAVPEPSSIVFVGLLVSLLAAIRRYRFATIR